MSSNGKRLSPNPPPTVCAITVLSIDDNNLPFSRSGSILNKTYQTFTLLYSQSMVSTNYIFMAVLGLVGVAFSFTSSPAPSVRAGPYLQHKTTANLFWFSGKDDGENNKKTQSDSSSDMRNVGEVMDSMDNFKKSGKVAKMTDSLVQELSTISVEGSAADGKVKVFFDGQQRPMNVEIDDTYLTKVSADDLNAALTTAMQDAHHKSAQKMEEKMKPFFSELGLTPR